MNKGFIIIIAIITISLIAYGAMAAQHNTTLANEDTKLKEVDAAAAHLIDVCNSESNPTQQGYCDANIMQLYNNECIDYKDKLSVCADNGPVEQYLTKAGYI